PAGRADVDQRHDDGEQRPGCADLVAAPCMCGARKESQRENEGHDRDQVEQVGDVGAHGPLPSCDASTCFAGARFLNISSMRSVTTNPPTTFADASTTATKPTIHVKALLSGCPRTIIAPTITIPWIEFVRDNGWLAFVASCDGRCVVPTIVTPLSTISSPGRVSSQLPPVSAARSTITEPGRIERTASAVISFGAGRPGIAAVEITASNSGM